MFNSPLIRTTRATPTDAALARATRLTLRALARAPGNAAAAMAAVADARNGTEAGYILRRLPMGQQRAYAAHVAGLRHAARLIRYRAGGMSPELNRRWIAAHDGDGLALTRIITDLT